MNVNWNQFACIFVLLKSLTERDGDYRDEMLVIRKERVKRSPDNIAKFVRRVVIFAQVPLGDELFSTFRESVCPARFVRQSFVPFRVCLHY